MIKNRLFFPILLLFFITPDLYAKGTIGLFLENTSYNVNYKKEKEPGVLVLESAENGPAYKSGIRENDIIFSVDGKRTKTLEGLVKFIQNKGGKEISVGVIRGGKRLFFKPTPLENIDYRYYRFRHTLKEQKALANELYEKKEYDNSFYLYFQAAQLGDIYSQYTIGWMYQKGLGTTVDYDQAKKYYEKAANNDHTSSQMELGEMYFNGDQIERNYKSSFYWSEKAAKEGNSNSQFRLGYLYDQGLGVNKNTNNAIYWYKKSADQENSSAQYNLGIIYQYGRNDFDSDLETAEYWYRKSGNNGHKEAKNKLDDLENPFFRAIQGTVNFVKENKEEIAAAGVAIGTAIVVDQMSADDSCFRPDNNCTGVQERKHKNFYSALNRYAKSWAPGNACYSNRSFADYINGVVDSAVSYGAGALLVSLNGDAGEILIEIDQVRKELSGDGHC